MTVPSLDRTLSGGNWSWAIGWVRQVDQQLRRSLSLHPDLDVKSRLAASAVRYEKNSYLRPYLLG
jgi:hypothetical protein